MDVCQYNNFNQNNNKYGGLKMNNELFEGFCNQWQLNTFRIMFENNARYIYGSYHIVIYNGSEDIRIESNDTRELYLKAKKEFQKLGDMDIAEILSEY